METWIHLLSSKNNALPILKAFVQMVESQFGLKVKTIRLDNAIELGSNLEDRIYLANKGILHQTTCVYTPTT